MDQNTTEGKKKEEEKKKKNSQQLFIQGVFTKKRKEKAKPFAFGKKDTSFRVYLHKSFVKYSFFHLCTTHDNIRENSDQTKERKTASEANLRQE